MRINLAALHDDSPKLEESTVLPATSIVPGYSALKTLANSTVCENLGAANLRIQQCHELPTLAI